ncbi:reverse transcriptase domain-containing protein [Tanacetum coccineum]
MIGSTFTEEGRNKLCGLLQRNLDIFAWKPADMTGVPRHIAEHRLNVRETYGGRNHEGNFKDLNKACPKDGYPLSEIDWKLESLCGFSFKCFLDVYKGYHQIQMEREDEEKTAFITSQGIFCYTKIRKDVLRIQSQHQGAESMSRQRRRGLKSSIPKILERQKLFSLDHGSGRGVQENKAANSGTSHVNRTNGKGGTYRLFGGGQRNDGSSCTDGSRAGLILTNPEGMEFTYALRFRFDATNNEAEYEALIAGLRIAKQIVVEEEGDTWMTPIFEYLTEETLPVDVKKAKAVRRKSQRFAVINGTLYKKSFLGPWLRFGLPGEIISDNEKEFQDNPFKDCLGEGIKARLDARSGNWMEELSHVLWAHRTMIKSSNGDTSFSLKYGMKAVIPMEISMPTLRTAEVDLVQNNEALEINLDLLEERREQAAIREAKSKAKMEKYYNSRVRSTSFKPGDLVYRNNEASRMEDTGNLGPKWEGPYEVTEALGKGTYKLRDRDGRQLPRTWNIRNLKKCYIHKM